MRRLLLCLSLFALACGNNDSSQVSVLLVDVNCQNVAGVVGLDVTLTNAGTSDTHRYSSSAPLTTTRLTATLPTSRTGVVDIAVAGVNASNVVIARGTTSVSLQPGGQANASVTLTAVQTGTDAGVPIGGTGGGAGGGGAGGGTAGASGSGGAKPDAAAPTVDATKLDVAPVVDARTADVTSPDVPASPDAGQPLTDANTGTADAAIVVDLATPVDLAPRGWINSEAYVRAGDNSFGIEGPWYGYGDGVSWDATKPAIYRDGKYCLSGTTLGTAGNWGAGIEFPVNMRSSVKLAYAYKNKIVGFRIKLSGTAPQGLRVGFLPWSVYPAGTASVTPFLPAAVNTDKVYLLDEAWVPEFWASTNAGARLGDELYGVQVQVPGDFKAGAYDFCIEAFEPVAVAAAPAPATCSVALADGFESGGFANWSTSSASPPKVVATSPLFGNYTAEVAVGSSQYVQKNFAATAQTRVSFLLSSSAIVTNTQWSAMVFAVGVPAASLPTLYLTSDGKGTPVLAACAQPLATEQDCAYVPMPTAPARVDFNWRRASGLTLGMATLAVDGKIRWQTNAAVMTDETATATGVQIGLLSNLISGSGGLRFDDVTIKTCQ